MIDDYMVEERGDGTLCVHSPSRGVVLIGNQDATRLARQRAWCGRRTALFFLVVRSLRRHVTTRIEALAEHVGALCDAEVAYWLAFADRYSGAALVLRAIFFLQKHET